MSDFEIEGDILEGLDGVKSPHSNKTNSNGNDTSHVMFSLLLEDEVNYGGNNAIKTVENPTIYDGVKFDSNDAYSAFDKAIIKHIKEHGTIDELMISGHGNYGIVSSGIDGSYMLAANAVLTRLQEIQQETGIKVANRVIFDACRTFSHLSPERIKKHREYAQENGVQIVGTTSLETAVSILDGALKYHSARYILFDTDGNIKRDKMDSKYDPIAALSNSTSWTDCFIGTTQEEGENLLNQKTLNVEHEQKARLKRIELEGLNTTFGSKF